MFNLFKSKPKNYTDISCEEFKNEMSAKDTVILDVRSAGEFNSGKIKGARNIDVMSANFVAQVQNLPKDKKYFVYCRSGARSAQACSILGNLGFSKAYNMRGGIMSWPYETV